MLRTPLLIGLIGATLPGCPKGGPVDAPPRENRMRSGHAPTPFSAKQIRESCGPGTWRKYRVEMAGRPPSYRVLRFRGATPKTTLVISEMTDLSGKPFGEQRELRTLWTSLQAHGSFPESRTRIRTERYVTPAGVFECWRYEVRSSERGKRVVKRLWFAKSLPGPPVNFDQLVDGDQVFRMILVARGRSGKAVRRVRPAEPLRRPPPARPMRAAPVPRRSPIAR